MDYFNPENTAKAGIEALKRFSTSIGMPINFKQLGAKEADIDAMAQSACYGNDRAGTVGNFVKLGKEDVKKIYQLMLEG